MSPGRLNWYDINSKAYTAICRDWPVELLERMSREGNDTPVSGTALRPTRPPTQARQQLGLRRNDQRAKLSTAAPRSTPQTGEADD